MGFTGSANQTEMTPYRKTRARLNVAWPVVVEEPWSAMRKGTEISQATPIPNTPHISHDVIQLASGAWAMLPLQDNISFIHERLDAVNKNAILRIAAGDWTVVDTVKERQVWRQSKDLGLRYGSGVAVAGDPFQRREVRADQGFDQSFGADLDSRGAPPDSSVLPMSRIAISTRYGELDQILHIRWLAPGTKMHGPELLWRVLFGGPVSGGGDGQYSLVFRGDGKCELFEKNGTGPSDWIQRAKWQYCLPQDVSGNYHYMRAWPHRKPDGKLTIEFHSDTAHGTPGFADPTGQNYTKDRQFNDTFILNIFEPTIPLAGVPRIKLKRPNATGVGPIIIDQRHDQLVEYQISLARFPNNALLVDRPIPITIPFFGTGQNFTLSWNADVPDGTTLTGFLFDPATSTYLTPVSSGPNYAVYRPNSTVNSIQAEFYFTTNSGGTRTPVLWSYQVKRDGLIQNTTTVEVIGKGRQYSISGPEADPSHESAQIEFKDVTDGLSLLRTRSFIHTIVETQYDQADATKKSILFQGVSTRTEALKRGTSGRTFPSPEWRDYEARFAGIWARLRQTISLSRFSYAVDTSVPADPSNGYQPPMKVTDLCRTMLTWCGFPSSMIDVPDSPIRFFSQPGSEDQFLIEPLINVADFVVSALKNYLGWFLVWDANAGTNGMIRARKPSVAPYTNLAAFQTAGPSAGKVGHRPESYGTPNWVGTNVPLFIRRGTYRTWIKPPEANLVIVTGSGNILPDGSGRYQLTNWAANPKSFNWGRNADGSIYESADPNHPDYIGYCVPLVVIDPTLGSQDAVDWHVRRYYDFTCHAIKMASFQAPLALVTDPNDAQQTKPRPLRYYDPVTINSAQFLIRNCNPEIQKDAAQWAQYECEAPRF